MVGKNTKIMQKKRDTTADPLYEEVQRIREAFINNVNVFYFKKFDSQVKFAKSLGISKATLNSYLNKATNPTADFAIRCSLVLEKSMNELFRTSEEASGPYHDIFPPAEKTDAAPYAGSYLLCYYNTSVYGGDEIQSPLSYAVMSIYKPVSGYAHILALMNLSGLLAEQYLDMAHQTQAKNLESLYETCAKETSSATLYSGNFQVTNNFAYCVFRTSGSSKDIATLMLRNAKQDGAKNEEKRPYIGGLGALLSTSRGSAAMPCLQLALVSRAALHNELSEEALEKWLQLGKPRSDLSGQADDVIRLVKLLYTNVDQEDTLAGGLSDEQKRLLIRDKLENLIDTALEQDLFHMRKISSSEDNQIYHLIKNTMKQTDGGGDRL